MKVYKGTDKDLKCRGYQFTPGVEAVEDEAKLCSKGFHACEAPLDVFGYYPPGLGSRYFEAELEDVSPERESRDSKVCGKRITIGAEIGIPGLVKAHIEWIKSQVNPIEEGQHATGDQGAASATGARGAASVNDCGGIAVASGYHGRAKAGLGSALCICERGEWNGKTCPLLAVRAAIVDGKTIKADTWYTLQNGEFVEVVEE